MYACGALHEVPDVGALAPEARAAVRRIAMHTLRVASTAAPVCLIDFDASMFDPRAFAVSDIAMPAAIARSVPKRQSEFFFGRLAARLAMQAMAFAPAEVPIGAARQPVWPAGIVGSISHARSTAAATVLDGRRHGGIGIDIEHVAAPDQQTALLETVVSEAEWVFLQGIAPALPVAWLLTIVFSAKESLFKAAFQSVGRYFDFGAAAVTALDVDRGTVELTLQEDLCRDFAAGQECRVGFEFIRDGMVLTGFDW